MANESELTAEQQIRSEALEQATRIAVRHNKTPKGHTALAIRIADELVAYIRDGS